MKQYFFISCLSVFSLFTLFGAYKLSYFIGEHFFFDKLFYYKSADYGYWTKNYNGLVNTQNKPGVEIRIAELKKLIAENNHSESRVLGVNTDSTQKNVFKIAIVGDSIAYGLGVKYEETFPHILERELNKIRPTKVYLLAQPGDDLVDNFTKYEMAEKTIHPDLYLFTLVDNDLTFNRPDWVPGDKETLTELKQGCPQPDYPHPDIREWPRDGFQILKQIYSESYSPQYAPYCILQEVAHRLPKEKSLFFSVFFYFKPEQLTDSSSEEDRLFSHVMSTYSDAFKKQGDRVVEVRDFPEFLYTPVSKQEGHPSAQTHQMYANILLDEILKNKEWKFKTQ